MYGKLTANKRTKEIQKEKWSFQQNDRQLYIHVLKKLDPYFNHIQKINQNGS